MDLMSIEVCGYRRFAKPNILQLNGKMIALVGPNEAGKSSLLKAIEHIGNTEEISQEEISRGVEVDPYIRAKYFLSGDELPQFGLKTPTWLTFTKNKEGKRRFGLSPKPERDLSKRKALKSLLKRFQKSKTAILLISEEDREEAISLSQKCLGLLDANPYDFDEDDFKWFQSLIDVLDDDFSENATPSLSNFKHMIENFIEFEKDHDPELKAGIKILESLPPILQFSYSDRDLGIPFDLTSSETYPKNSLQRLLDLSGLDLEQLNDAVISNNAALIRGIIEQANSNLDAALVGRWSQSGAKIKFEVTNSLLDLIVEHPEFKNFATKYNNYSERSDGFKQFMALAVFAVLENAQDSILLIDEADMHLHYDAQADLVQILTKQSLSKKVIYTTHSAGCLPEDMGNGVRLIEWDKKEKNKSNISNKFWGRKDSEGFSPLLLGMGATTFAFFPSRNAVVAEGVSEMMLLAYILREASGLENLGFQIVPGLSNLSKKQLPLIGRAGSKVAYIVDNDAGGRELETLLIKNGIERGRIKKIASGRTLLTLEDCLRKDVWAEAVNKYIDKYGEKLGVTKITKFRNSNRVLELPKQLQSCKVDFCYNIQEMIFENPDLKIVSPKAKGHLESVVKEIHALFKSDDLN